MNVDEDMESITDFVVESTGEFSDLSLGDTRLDRRLDEFLGKLLRNPGKSLPDQAAVGRKQKRFIVC